MADLLQTARNNWKHKPIPTIAVTLGLLVVMVVIFVLVGASTQNGYVGLAVSIPLTIFLSTRIDKLAWYWGIGIGNAGMTSLETQALEVLPFTMVPRGTPKGTKLIELTSDKAVFQVKAIIQFWNWFLPLNLVAVACLSIPALATVSYITNDDARNLWQQGVLERMFVDAALGFVFFLMLAVISYFMTRPNVRVLVKPDIIKFGSYRFDRRYVGGLREGFKSQGVETRPSFVSPKFGSTNLYMEYGAWGERMKYLVDAESAVEIVVWANEIIDRVGKADAVAPTASEGVKTEML